MAAKKEPTKRKPMTLERAREFIKKHAPRRRSKSGGGSRGGVRGLLGTGSLGHGGDVSQLATWGIGGAVALASFFTFPSWLSPLGVSLFIYGWWRGNAQIKSVGALLVIVQFVQSLGVVQLAQNKLAQIRAEGFRAALTSGASSTGAPTQQQVAAAAPKR